MSFILLFHADIHEKAAATSKIFLFMFSGVPETTEHVSAQYKVSTTVSSSYVQYFSLEATAKSTISYTAIVNNISETDNCLDKANTGQDVSYPLKGNIYYQFVERVHLIGMTYYCFKIYDCNDKWELELKVAALIILSFKTVVQCPITLKICANYKMTVQQLRTYVSVQSKHWTRENPNNDLIRFIVLSCLTLSRVFVDLL